MSKRTALCLFFLSLFTSAKVVSQSLGLLPYKTKWYSLTDDSLRIIYPEGQEETARRVATKMLRLAQLDPITQRGRYKPIDVLLQPYTNVSNGYVGLAPYLSEFYLEPHENPFELGSLPWADMLALHEYRHVQQVNAANTGISHLAKVVFGELVFSGLYSAAIPNWYREGDAVYTETKWSSQGRGRLSQFTLPFFQKAMIGDPWNYYKVRNGSYREFTPDYYALGYMMVHYGNQYMGESAWDSIIHHAPRFKNIFNPFSGIVKHEYGKNNKGLYRDAMSCYHDECRIVRTTDVLYPEVNVNLSKADDIFFDMSFPVVDGDGSVYAAVVTFDHTGAIVRIEPDGHRKKIVSTGRQKDNYFHYSNDILVWTELRNDPRWLRRDHNVIIVYDVRQHRKKAWSDGKGYFTPSLDASGARIVCLYESVPGQYNLRLLDTKTGKVIRDLPNPENLYLGYPVFNPEGESIIATARNKTGQMCLVEQDIRTGEVRFITHYSFNVLGRPHRHGPWIFIATGIDQLNQVFAVDDKEGIFYQVSDGNNAHYSPYWDPVQDDIVCSEYTLEGKRLVRVSGEQYSWKLVNLDNGIRAVSGVGHYDLLAEADRPVDDFDVRRYSAWANPIHFHSWIVTANDPAWGIEARSVNKLNTITFSGGYLFNRHTHDHGPYLDLVLGMYYPQLIFGISHINRETVNETGQEYRRVLDRFHVGLSLPLTFNGGVYQQQVLLSSILNLGFRRNKPDYNHQDYSFNYMRYRVLLINSRRRAYRQAMPSFAQRAEMIYSKDMSGVTVSQFYLASDFAFPGITPTHYLLAQTETLLQDLSPGSIQLASSYNGPRGFPYVEGEKQYRLGVTYGFPFLYPDIGFGNVMYTKRLRLQPFFDWAYSDAPQLHDTHMVSAGLELVVDFDFPPLGLGFRYSRLLEGSPGNPNVFELFIPTQRF